MTFQKNVAPPHKPADVISSGSDISILPYREDGQVPGTCSGSAHGNITRMRSKAETAQMAINGKSVIST